jgi:hypothetical protein
MTFDQADLQATQGVAIQSITLTAGGPITVAAPTVSLAQIDAAQHSPVTLAVTGVNGASANWVGVHVVNADQVVFTDLKTHSGAIQLPANLSLQSATVRDRLDITTNQLTLRLDNVNQGAQNVDGQLITPYGNFWAELTGSHLQTDALVTRYRAPMTLSYAGQNQQNNSGNVAFYGLSGEFLQNNATQVGNVGPRERELHWFERVLNFVGLDLGVNEESAQDDQTQDEDPAEYTTRISNRI